MAKQQQKEAEQLAKNVQKELEKMAKQQQKEAEQLAKQQQKTAEKMAKQQQKEAQKMDKQIAKEAEQLDKQRKRETEKLVRLREKEASRSAVLRERERVKELAEKKAIKKSEKYEIQTKAIGKMVQVAKQMAAANPGGFTIAQITQKYVSMFPNTNPYTLEPIDDPEYDISAAIRGFVYETSPSSEQHWFRYGYKKIREQVAPWIFVNKELAIVNHSFQWKKTTSEIATARRQNKGLWKLIPDGSLAFYDWNEEAYGPLPNEEMLIEAAENRKKGVRRSTSQ
jgi:hypothetical protein